VIFSLKPFAGVKFTAIREQQNSFEPYFWNMKADLAHSRIPMNGFLKSDMNQ